MAMQRWHALLRIALAVSIISIIMVLVMTIGELLDVHRFSGRKRVAGAKRVTLRIFVYVDDDFIKRFGSRKGAGRKK